MSRFGFIIDNRKCIGCHACTVACKSEHDVAVGVNRTWVKYIEKGEFPNSRRLFSVLRCNQCDDAPCVTICPVTALFRRDDGIVDFDNRRCIGCKACMQACPYDALYIDPKTHTAAKCNYCAHRVDVGLEPACVNVCPTHAIISGDLDDPESEISQLKSREQVTARKVEKGTIPKLFYIEADDASLNPGDTTMKSEPMWNEQVRGVGHYADFMKDKLATNNTLEAPGNAVGVVDSLEKFLSLGEDGNGVLVNQPGDQAREHGQYVAKEVARKTYDAPNKGVLWGWQVTAYMWTKSIAAGAVLVPLVAWITGMYETTATTKWPAAIVSLIFMGLTGLLLRHDLDQPNRFLYVLLRPQWRSWLVKGAYIISVFVALLIAWCVLMVTGSSGTALNVTQCLVIGFATLTAIYTAFLFAQAKGRDFWQSPMLAVHMFAHAVMAGGAVFSFGVPFSNVSWSSFVCGFTVLGIALHLISTFLELGTTHATEDARRTAHSITRGRYSKLFWLGVVLGGNGVPVVLLIWMPALAPLAGLMVLAGIYLSEHIWVRAPQQLALA